MDGRKPKPTALKKLEGNPGKRKMNTKESVSGKGMPDCPKWLLRNQRMNGKGYNKPDKNKNHVPKCTKVKELLIMEALKFYDLMEQDVKYREDAA